MRDCGKCPNMIAMQSAIASLTSSYSENDAKQPAGGWSKFSGLKSSHAENVAEVVNGVRNGTIPTYLIGSWSLMGRFVLMPGLYSLVTTDSYPEQRLFQLGGTESQSRISWVQERIPDPENYFALSVGGPYGEKETAPS